MPKKQVARQLRSGRHQELGAFLLPGLSVLGAATDAKSTSPPCVVLGTGHSSRTPNENQKYYRVRIPGWVSHSGGGAFFTKFSTAVVGVLIFPLNLSLGFL